MHAEYKRDMNHNYLVLHGEEIDTSSYQVRMLVGNIIPSLLKCRIQGIDGKFAIYYDITSRQSLSSFYENKKIGHEDLRVIFGEFIRVMEDASEYLMNPGQIVLAPEFMFLEVERREIYFCFFPGYQKDMKKQFQELTEYILPKIDHEDEAAVRIGYGIYRRTMDDGFQLEHMKEELFRGKEQEIQKKDLILQEPEIERTEAFITKTSVLEENSEEFQEELWIRNEARENKISVNHRRDDGKNKNNNKIFKKVKLIVALCFVFAFILILKVEGYLSELEVFTVLGLVVICMGTGIFFSVLIEKMKKKKERRQKKVEPFLRKIDRTEEKHEVEWERDSFNSATEMNIERKINAEEAVLNCGETVVLSMNVSEGPASLVSREPGELATIYLEKDLMVIGKLETASDAVINLPTVSRVHAKIRKKDGEYYLTDLNSKNGTTVNGRILKAEEEYCLQNEDEIDFAQARYIFLGK